MGAAASNSFRAGVGASAYECRECGRGLVKINVNLTLVGKDPAVLPGVHFGSLSDDDIVHVLSFLPVSQLVLAASVDRQCWRLRSEALKSRRCRMDLAEPEAWLIGPSGEIEMTWEEIYAGRMGAVASKKHCVGDWCDIYVCGTAIGNIVSDFRIGNSLRLAPDESLLVAIGAASPVVQAAREAAAAAAAAAESGPWGPWVTAEADETWHQVHLNKETPCKTPCMTPCYDPL